MICIIVGPAMLGTKRKTSKANADESKFQQRVFELQNKYVIGASELMSVWTDPDFDPYESAFYYARVLEIPTPRWVLYDKVRLGAELD